MEKGDPMANTHSHLTLSDRIYIEQALERRMKFKDIAVFIRKDPTTVSKEIRRHRAAKESAGKRRCVKTGAPAQNSICAARVIIISCAENALCTTAILTAKITLPLYADGLPRRLMFAMAVGFGIADRIQNITTVHKLQTWITVKYYQARDKASTKQRLNRMTWIASYPRFSSRGSP